MLRVILVELVLLTETFIIQHLFISKDLQEYLSGLTENKEETDTLKVKLKREKKELEKLIKVKNKAYKLLLDPDFEDDETIKTELQITKKRIKDKEQSIEILENRLIERDAHSGVKRVKIQLVNIDLMLVLMIQEGLFIH